ncbi:DNA-binding protein WhiA [Sporohalobacter salinus]|uniref:DNA-binding protein WhiA n=1 Tax=Sporohalobacter salinus TaxID=1494606 RepID=UPI001960902F|nr:DNA-binding protein WhiA [Sporohalobacter salinus]MBM7624206.1 DNA-binding protein WhiA [Sporohalobacter salinus]
MSFSDQVKNEAARIEVESKCCGWAQLSALIKANGSLEIVRKRLALKLVSQHATVARQIYQLLKERFNLLTKIMVRRNMYLNKDNYYIIKLPPQKGVKELLINCGLIDDNYSLNDGIEDRLVANQCCKRAYFRGSFLGGGSVNDPESSYHLEIRVNKKDYAKKFADLVADSFGLNFRIRSRNDDHLLYLKKAEEIVKVLNIIGAHNSLLEFENTRVVKEVRNQVNRIVNCETANLNKTIEAARDQIENIKLIEAIKGLDSLSPSLLEIAELRLENPYASFKELGELLEPTLSKSGVNHRLRRINKLADELRDERNLSS